MASRFARALLALALLAGAAAAADDAQVVHVYNWSDYVSDDVVRAFEAETGIRVVYDVYDSNEVLEAKLLAGRSGYDLIFPSARPFAANHIAAGLYARLDLAALPNRRHLDPAVMADLATADPGNAHLVPYLWGSTGLGLNEPAVRQALGPDVPLDTWAVLFDPANARRLAGCGIALLDDEQEGHAAALLYLGRNPNSGAPEDLAAAQQALAAIRPYVRYFHSSKYLADLAGGEICVALGYSGDVLQARARARETDQPFAVRYVIPREGALRAVDVAAIPADAPHPRAAHRLLDYLMRPAVAAAITNAVAYPNANTAATALVDPALRDDPGIYPPPDVAARLVAAATLDPAATRARLRAWQRLKAGH